MSSEFMGRASGPGHRRRTYQPMSEINVTPFVDVMLVLLIVFMVTAPLLTVGVPIDVPKVDTKHLSEPVEPLTIKIDATGQILIQDTKVDLKDLVPRLRAISENKTDTRIFLRGDRTLSYGEVMEVMARLNVAGFTRVAMITVLPKRGKSKN